jgi:glutamate-1-semialdehyde 2,1-aminomutase
MERTKTRALFQQARAVMPLGVSSNFRYWGDDHTNVFVKGEKGYIYDADGNRFIDYRLAFGPIILGHAYGPVVERVNEAMRSGTLFAATHPWEIKVAERIIAMCPGVERVRFANSGTEATMHALRIARAYTNREKVIKFEGQYHGFHDYLLFSTATARLPGMGSPHSPVSAQISSGIPERMRELCINLPYNDFDLLQQTVEAKWGDIAAIIVRRSWATAPASCPPTAGWSSSATCATSSAS